MLTYESATELLGKKDMKKLAGNTTLRKERGNMVVRFWGTDIISISPDNIFTLNAGGYETVTTKDRLNKFSPARVYQDKGIWYIYERTPFVDGIRVNSDGMVIA
jgi:hypothetical protein